VKGKKQRRGRGPRRERTFDPFVHPPFGSAADFDHTLEKSAKWKKDKKHIADKGAA